MNCKVLGDFSQDHAERLHAGLEMTQGELHHQKLTPAWVTAHKPGT